MNGHEVLRTDQNAGAALDIPQVRVPDALASSEVEASAIPGDEPPAGEGVGSPPMALLSAGDGGGGTMAEDACAEMEGVVAAVAEENSSAAAGLTSPQSDDAEGKLRLKAVMAEVLRLAKLSPLEYDLVRKKTSKDLGISLSTLDAEVKRARGGEDGRAGKPIEYAVVDAWEEEVDGEALLAEIRDVVKRFIICEPETAVAVALWSAFTWFVDVVQVAPLAIITAPEKRCGKSQLLDLMGRLCPRRLVASNITPSALFRVIERDHPTLLIDEADSFLKIAEDLRGIINSGHTRTSAFVMRTVGEDFEPKQFSTWGAKILCGIGKLPETIMDRGIILELRRKLPTESVERLRNAPPDLFPRLASMLARWSEDHQDAVRFARPVQVEVLNDREQDSWEPIFAIADCAGGAWPEIARKAAVKLSERNAENTVSSGVELLSDIRSVFESNAVDRLSTTALLAGLTADVEQAWCTFDRGKPMTAKQLAKQLRAYEIVSGTIRTNEGTPKGYKREQFADSFMRYLDGNGKKE